MKKKLGEILVEQGAVRPEDLAEALSGQNSGDARRVGELLLAAGKVTAAALARALAAQLGMPFVQLDQVQPEVAALVPMETQRQHMLVPFRDEGRGKAVHIAVADPATRSMAAELEFTLGRPVVVSLAPADEILSVHAALEGDVVPAVILDDGEPATTEPLAPLPAPKPKPTSQTLAKLVLKKVAVLAGPAPAAVPAFAADVPPLELPSPPVRPRTGNTSGKGYPAIVSSGPPASAAPPPGTVSMRPPAQTELPQRAKRSPVKTDPALAPPVLKPAVAEPAAAPKKPRTAPRLPKVAVPTDEWAVKDAGRAIPSPKPELGAPEEPEASPLVNLFESDPVAPTETARVDQRVDPVPPTETGQIPRKSTGGQRVEAKKPPPVADPWASPPPPRRAVKTLDQFPMEPAPSPPVAPGADPWAPPITAEPSGSRSAVKTSAQHANAAPAPPTATPQREITTSVQFLLPEQREEAKKVLAWSDKSAPPAGSQAFDSGLLSLPDWMREGGPAGAASGDALTAAVEKAVLVSGAPRTVARLLRLLVDRGLLTEGEILEELSKP
jgi:hypothetical protein